MTMNVLFGVAGALWLTSMIACVLALRWSRCCLPRRFPASLIASALALAIGYLGMTRLHVAASKTVNGQVQWRFDSRWLFTVTLLFSAFTLAYTLWKQRKAARSA